jgi:HTH-type transcriptional regulator/antitoxin HipB
MSDFAVRTPQQVAQLLQAFRKARQLTQQDLAQRLGTTQQAVSRLERDATGVSIERVMRALAVLGVELILRDTAAAPRTGAKPRKRGAVW